MKILIEQLIRFRNPKFKMNSQLSNTTLMKFVISIVIDIIRGLKVGLYMKNPKFVMFKSNVKIFNISKITWGKFLKIGQGAYLSALTNKSISIGNNVSIGAFSRIIVSTTLNNLNGFIKIGNNVGLGEFAYLGGAAGLEIQNDCIIGQYFSCHPENHNYNDTKIPIRLQGVSHQGIKIENNCWIGSKVTILDGVTIGPGCVIAAGSVVTKSFPANCVIAGVPAKLIKNRN